MSAVKAAGLSRGEVYLTNLVKLRPPHNNIAPYFNGTSFTPAGAEWVRLLRDEVAELAAPVVVAVGKSATVALTGDARSLFDLRGSPLIFAHKGVRKVVIPTIHPSFILHTGQFLLKFLLHADIKNALALAREGGVEALPARTILANPTFDQALDWLRRLMDEPEFAFDIETSADQLTVISFAPNPFEAVAIPPAHYDNGQRKQLWAAMQAVLENPASRKITQNGNYDTFFLDWFYGIKVPLASLDDLMVAHSIMWPRLIDTGAADTASGKSLALICSLWACEPFYKDEADRSRKDGDFTRYQNYCAKDSLITFHAWDRIKPLLEADPAFLHTYRFTMARLPAIQAMQRTGWAVDHRGLQAEREQLVSEMALLQAELDQVAAPILSAHLDPELAKLRALEAKRANIRAQKGDTKPLTAHIGKLRTRLRQWCRQDAGKPVEWEWTLPWSPGASEKGCTYFYEFCGEPEHTKRRKAKAGGAASRSRSIDDDALAKLAKPTDKRPGYEEARLFQQLRERDKLITSYIDIEYMPGTGRFHSSFNLRGTVFGRYSSSQLFFRYGANQQNIPPRIRQYYLADPPKYEAVT